MLLSRCYSWNDLGSSWMLCQLAHFGCPTRDTGHFQDWATLNMHDPVLVEFLVPESLPRSGGRSAALQLVPVVLALAALVPRTSCWMVGKRGICWLKENFKGEKRTRRTPNLFSIVFFSDISCLKSKIAFIIPCCEERVFGPVCCSDLSFAQFFLLNWLLRTFLDILQVGGTSWVCCRECKFNAHQTTPTGLRANWSFGGIFETRCGDSSQWCIASNWLDRDPTIAGHFDWQTVDDWLVCVRIWLTVFAKSI